VCVIFKRRRGWSGRCHEWIGSLEIDILSPSPKPPKTHTQLEKKIILNK